jgi:hypothetical protein
MNSTDEKQKLLSVDFVPSVGAMFLAAVCRRWKTFTNAV